MARKLGILVPVRIEDIERPYGFGRIQTADLLDWYGSLDHNGLCKDLLPALEKLLGKASVEEFNEAPAEIKPAALSQTPIVKALQCQPPPMLSNIRASHSAINSGMANQARKWWRFRRAGF